MILLLRRVKSMYYENERDFDELLIYFMRKSSGCSTKENIQFKIPHEIVLHR